MLSWGFWPGLSMPQPVPHSASWLLRAPADLGVHHPGQHAGYDSGLQPRPSAPSRADHLLAAGFLLSRTACSTLPQGSGLWFPCTTTHSRLPNPFSTVFQSGKTQLDQIKHTGESLNSLESRSLKISFSDKKKKNERERENSIQALGDTTK